MKKAEPLLHRIIDGEGRADGSAVAWARRSLALAWASSGDYKQSQEALDLLNENLRNHKTPEDQRAQALVLAMRPGGRREAIQELEESFAERRPRPDEEFLLARLYEANRDWDQAKTHFLNLATAPEGANPMHLAYYVIALLRRKDVNSAAQVLAGPGEGRSGQLPHDGGEGQGAASAGRRRRRGAVAEGLRGEGVPRQEGPERAGRRGRPAGGTGPNRGGRGVLSEICRGSRRTASGEENPAGGVPGPATAVWTSRSTSSTPCGTWWVRNRPRAEEAAAIRVAHPTARQFRRVESRVREAVRKDPGDADLLVSLADLRDAQGRHDESVKIYRTILAANPRSVLASTTCPGCWRSRGRNRRRPWTWWIAPWPSPARRATFWTRRAWSFSSWASRPRRCEFLTDAADQTPTASVYFHLAEAQKAAAGGAPGDAEKAWQKAQELGLKEVDLHPLERPDYQKWLAERKDG